MKRIALLAFVALLAISIGGNEADGRGFGGYRGGGFSSFGGYHTSSYGRSGFDSFEGSRSGGYRTSSYGGWDRAAGGSSYDRNFSGNRGGSVNVAGERGFAARPRGAAGGEKRDVTATGPNGRTYNHDSERGAAVGPNGRYVGGAGRSTTVTGEHGAASWQSAFATKGHMSTDFGLSHYSTFNAAGFHGGTVYHSHYDVHAQSGFVRGTFGYYNCFHPNWVVGHPGCWRPWNWEASWFWLGATWAMMNSWCSFPSPPINYNYGDNVVIQDNSVTINGQPAGTAEQYAAQAAQFADAGQKADPAPKADWKALGVFALVQGDQTSSNNVFQLAVSKEGIIRGNYYDGLMDTTTPVYGSVDKKSQRAAWTIGKKNDRVFEAGMQNLTEEQAPLLVHIGKDKTQQWLLVRLKQQSDAGK